METGQKHKLLVIDDSSLMRSALALVLVEAGFDVKTAANVEEFENLLSEWWPDTILSDVQMPDVSGDELCRTLKSRLLVRVVLFSNVHPERLAKLAESAGADGYISKLAGFERLPTTLLEIIERTGGGTEADTKDASSDRPCRILLVDDTELGREVTGTILAREGFDVRIAGSLDDAASVLDGWETDVILTNPRIGTTESHELCSEMKRTMGSRSAPIVFYGDLSSDRMTAMARESGAQAGLSRIEGYSILLGKLRTICKDR